MAESKPFEATPRKLREARKRGQVLRAPMTGAAIQLLTLMIVLGISMADVWLHFQILLEYSIVWGFSNPFLCLKESAAFIVELVFPALGISSAACLLIEFWQAGPGWYPWAGGGVNVVSGTRKVVKGLCSIHFVALKTFSVLAVSLCCMSGVFRQTLFLRVQGSSQALMLFERLVREVGVPVLVCVISLAAIEYVMKRRQFRAELSMSFDELRQELKEEEGDPHVRAARRQLHRALAYEELVARVRKSKVLIVERA